MKHPTPQSATSHKINKLLRTVSSVPDKFVWAVFNSGDPILDSGPYSIELVLFESKHTALDFVRSLLLEHWNLDASKFNDKAVMEAMFSNDDDRYLHLFEVKIHSDDYCTINLPF